MKNNAIYEKGFIIWGKGKKKGVVGDDGVEPPTFCV
jgi:hypothetical protein